MAPAFMYNSMDISDLRVFEGTFSMKFKLAKKQSLTSSDTINFYNIMSIDFVFD